MYGNNQSTLPQFQATSTQDIILGFVEAHNSTDLNNSTGDQHVLIFLLRHRLPASDRNEAFFLEKLLQYSSTSAKPFKKTPSKLSLPWGGFLYSTLATRSWRWRSRCDLRTEPNAFDLHIHDMSITQ